MRYEGNIYRPPVEWKSHLLQCTIGCSNNTCTFCGMFKDKSFCIRPLDDILEDIDMAYHYYRKNNGYPVTQVFLCDGDAIIMKQKELLTILEKLSRTFPKLEHVNTYAGPRSTMTKTVHELRELREAGLYRAYLGVETGSDSLLKKVKKGVNAKEMLEAGLRLKESGFDLWAIVMMGLAGPGKASEEHVLETARLINAMEPQHLSAMTYMAAEGTEMYEEVRAGRFTMLTQNEILAETKLLIGHLDVTPLHFNSDHASNYLPLEGTLPDDRETLSALIDGAIDGSVATRGERGRGL
jgi:radical SAM superfamily enzyme YgiQ (UPF0313 family)